MRYKTKGTCSQLIDVELNDDETIKSVVFYGGCSGNTQGIAGLVKGQDARAVIEKIRGIRCGMKLTSCPDQLSKALEKALEEKKG